MTELSDSELIKMCLEGQKEAFSDLVRRYHKPVYGFVFRMVKNRAVAEDITQESFLAAYRSLANCTKREGFSKWLLAISVNLSKKWFTRQKSKQLQITEDIQLKSKPLNDTLKIDLNQAVTELPDEERIIISMKYHNDMSCSEISDATGRPIGTITRLLAQAYSRIRNKMNNQGAVK